MSPHNARWSALACLLLLAAGCTTNPGPSGPAESRAPIHLNGTLTSSGPDLSAQAAEPRAIVRLRGTLWPATDATAALLGASVGDLQTELGQGWHVALAVPSNVTEAPSPTSLLGRIHLIAYEGRNVSDVSTFAAQGHWTATGASGLFVAEALDVVPLRQESLQTLPPTNDATALRIWSPAFGTQPIPTGTPFALAAGMLVNATSTATGSDVYTLPAIFVTLQPMELLGGPLVMDGVMLPAAPSWLPEHLQGIMDEKAALQAEARTAGLSPIPGVDVADLLRSEVHVTEHSLPGFFIAVDVHEATMPHASLQDLYTRGPTDLVAPIRTEGYVVGSTIQTACLALAQPECTELPLDVGIYAALNVSLPGPRITQAFLIEPSRSLGATHGGEPLDIWGIYITKSLARSALAAHVAHWATDHGQAATATSYLAPQPWIDELPGFIYVVAATPRLALQTLPCPVIATATPHAPETTLTWTPSLSPNFAAYEIRQGHTMGDSTTIQTITEAQATTATVSGDAYRGHTFTVWSINRDGTSAPSNPLQA